MAIGTPTLLGSTFTHEGSDVNTKATGSYTPSAVGNLILIVMSTQNALGQLDVVTNDGTISVSTTHSGSWSWNYIQPVGAIFDPNTGNDYYGRLHIAYAFVPTGGNSAGDTTITFNGGGGTINKNRNIVLGRVIEVSGVDTTTPILQSASNRVTNNSALTVTLSSTQTSSTVIGIVGNAYTTTDTNVTAPTGYTELLEVNSAQTDNQQLQIVYDAGSPGTSLNWTTLATSGAYGSGGLAIELKEAVTDTYLLEPSLIL